jgi:hypothetical protein
VPVSRLIQHMDEAAHVDVLHRVPDFEGSLRGGHEAGERRKLDDLGAQEERFVRDVGHRAEHRARRRHPLDPISTASSTYTDTLT